jgi:hypothetical protein
MGKRPSRACLRNQRRDKHTSCYCLPNERIFCAMADVKVTCVCGAIYEVIKTVGPSRKRGLINASCATGNYSYGMVTMLVNCTWSGVLTRIESSG